MDTVEILRKSIAESRNLDPAFLWYKEDDRCVLDIIKSDTRCSDRIVDVMGTKSSRMCLRFLNGVPARNGNEEACHAAVGVMADLTSERAVLTPIHFPNSSGYLPSGVSSGMESHVAVTPAATILGMLNAKRKRLRQWYKGLCNHR